MKKIRIGLIVAVVVAAIALVARGQFAESPAAAAPEAGSAASSVETRSSVVARTDGGVDASSLRSERAGSDSGADAGSGGSRTDVAGDDGGDPDDAAARGSDGSGPRTADEPAPTRARETERPSAEAGTPSGGTEGPSPGRQMPSPETVLERAAAAYENVRSLRADFVQRLENTLLGSTATSRGTIYQRRPDRFLMRFTEPAGDVIVGDGEHFWIYYPSIDEAQVIRAPMDAGGAGGVDLQAQFLGDPTERFDATLNGTEAVDGRDAWVLTLDPKRPLGYERMKVWVDAEDHLVRRFEIWEPNGVVRRIELNDLAVNPSLADSLFRFTPPEGARVVDRG